MRPSSGDASPTFSTTPAPRDRARRSLESQRPASPSASACAVAREDRYAAAEILAGLLLENPHRVGHPPQGEYAGQYSARRGPDWRVHYRIDEDTRTVIVLDISHRSDTYGR
jgi:mRNA interferase RelE/StbE